MEKKPEQKQKTTNVLNFPMEQRVPDGVLVPPEFKKRQAQDFLTVLCGEIGQAIVCSAAANGVNCEAENFRDDIIFLEMVLETILYRTEGLEHPLNDLIEELVEKIVVEPNIEQENSDGEP